MSNGGFFLAYIHVEHLPLSDIVYVLNILGGQKHFTAMRQPKHARVSHLAQGDEYMSETFNQRELWQTGGYSMNEANRGHSIKSEGKRLVSRRYIHSGSLALVPELRSSCDFFLLVKTLVRTASTVETVLRPVSFFATLLAAAWLVFQLRNVHDSTNLSRDIGLLGRVMVAALSECGVTCVVHVEVTPIE